MRVLVCGGREYQGDVSCLAHLPIDVLIHGGCRGADLQAAAWAKSRGIHRARVDALWDYYGKSAGFRRNEAMLLLQPEYCVAFPGGKGTQSMIDLCLRASLPVWRPYG